MERSKFFSLNTRDFLKGLLVAVLTALITGLYQWVEVGAILTWIALKPIVLVSIAAGLSYLVKNLFTNTGGAILTTEK